MYQTPDWNPDKSHYQRNTGNDNKKIEGRWSKKNYYLVENKYNYSQKAVDNKHMNNMVVDNNKTTN